MAHRVAVPQELLIGSSLTATQAATATILRCLHTLVAAPEIVFLATLAAMLFRPPDLPFHSLDRIAFLLLSSVVVLKILLERQPFQIPILVTWPMFGLLLLGFFSLLSQPYDPQNWSVFAAKWAVPFACYEISGIVFLCRGTASDCRNQDSGCVVVLRGFSCMAGHLLKCTRTPSMHIPDPGRDGRHPSWSHIRRREHFALFSPRRQQPSRISACYLPDRPRHVP